MAIKNVLIITELILILILPKVLNKAIHRKLIVNANENSIKITLNSYINFNFKTLKDRFKENPYKIKIGNTLINYENIDFNKLQRITYLTFIWNHSVKDCSYMLYNLTTATNIDLTNFDFTNINNTEKMFAGCQNLKSIIFPNKALNLSIIDMNHMFCNCSSLTTLSNFAKLEISSVKNISAMFYNCKLLKNLAINNIKAENVLNASYMFYSCSSLITLDSQNLIMPNVLDISYMFYNCVNLKILNLSNFNSTNILNIDSIFEKCNAIVSLDLSNFYFINISLSNQLFESLSKLQLLKLSNIKIYNNSNISYLFINNNKLQKLYLNNFNAESSVVNMETLFWGLINLQFLDMSNFKIANGGNVKDVFRNSPNLVTLNLSNFKYIYNGMFNGLSKLQNLLLNNAIIHDTNLSYLFSNLISLSSLDLSKFHIDNAQIMSYMFNNCKKLTKLNLSDLNTSNVKYMISIFEGCSILSSLNLSNWDFSKIKHSLNLFNNLPKINYIQMKNGNLYNISNIRNLFSNLKTLVSLDISYLNISSITNLEYMFSDCIKLQSINLLNIKISQVENIRGMFYNCKELTSLDLSGMITDNVHDMSYMFGNCNKLTSLNLSNFKTSNVINMASIFKGCSILRSLDISNWDFSKISNYINIFNELTAIKYLKMAKVKIYNIKNINQLYPKNIISLDISYLNISSVTNLNDLFKDYNNLQVINLSNINASHIQNMSGMFYNCKVLSNVDLSGMITNNVKYMSKIFYNCIKLNSLNLTNVNTSNVINMGYMFYNCALLKYLDLSYFNTSNVNNMEYLFAECKSLTSLNLSSFNTPKITKMVAMFQNCKALIKLDLSNFNTHNIKDMKYIFKGCLKLTSIDVSSFDTNLVEDFTEMFYNCQILKSLVLSNFRTNSLKKETTLLNIFNGCITINYLDLSNWDFSKISFKSATFNDNLKRLEYLKLSNVTFIKNTMASLFSSLENIISLNLSNFKASNVVYMNNMFYNSKRLKTLDLSNFYTNKVITMASMFQNCIALTSLDLSSFDTSLVTNFNYMFNDIRALSYIKLNFNLTSKKSSSSKDVFNETINFEYCISNITDMMDFYNIIITLFDTTRDCSMRCYDDLYILDTETNECILFDCRSNISYPYKYNYKCYSKCPAKTYLASNITNLCLFLYCDNYYDYEQNNCIDEIPVGYFLNDSYEKTIDKCHPDCKYCYGKPVFNNQNCKECYPDKFLYLGNCVDKCPYGYYFDENDSSIKICFCSEKCKECSLDSYNLNLCITCNEGYLPMFNNNNNSLYRNYHDCIKNNGQEIDSKIEISYEMINNVENIKNKNFDNYNYTSQEKNNKIHEEINNFILNNIENINKEEEIVIEGEDNIHYMITSLDNNLDNKESSNKFTTIDLGECEDVLRLNLNIDKNISFLLLLSENLTNVSSERNTQFEIYDPVNKQKVNLSICQDIQINMYVPVKLNENMNNLYNDLKDKGYDLFDINDDFYQDICTPYKSENGTDIPLSDRINYYYNNDQTQCQPGCNFSDYSIETQKLKCDCFTSKEETNNNEKVVKEDSKAIYESFYDVLKFSNYKILKCYKLVFKLNIFINNIGTIITEIYFIIYLIFILFSLFKANDILKDNLNKIKPLIYDTQKEIHNNPIIINKQIEKTKNLNIINEVIKANKGKSGLVGEINIDDHHKQNKLIAPESSKEKRRKYEFSFPPKRITRTKFKLKNVQFNLNNNENCKSNNFSLGSKNKIKADSEINNGKLFFESLNNIEKKYDDYELNNLNFELAMKYDKRNLFPMYWSILKREHPIIFTFFIRNDYNIIYVKYARLFFRICTDMALNVFFFSDKTMHKMFLDYGKYNFFQQIPQIIYSAIVSQLIDLFLSFLSLTDKHFYQIKNLNIKKIYDINIIFKLTKVKIKIFYIFTFIMFIFYWYIITCFCAVYTNSQLAFIKDSIISFILSLLYPFVLYLFPSILRIISIRCNSTKLLFLYKLSDIIPFF